jgi:hypothetical protein
MTVISQLQQADVVLDTSTTPWTEKYYAKGTTNLLLTSGCMMPKAMTLVVLRAI